MPTRHLQVISLKSAVLIVAIVEPPVTIPQIYQIWVHHQTVGVSILTWSLYGLASLIWLVYGLKISSWPIIISSSLWVIMDGAVVAGVMAR